MREAALKRLSMFVAITLMVAAVAIVCTNMLAACMASCTPHSASITLMTMPPMSMDCPQLNHACVPNGAEHMTPFSAVYPSTAAHPFVAMLLLVVSWFIAWWQWGQRQLFERMVLRLRERFRSYQRTLNRAHTNFYVFAFSQGILNPKIYR